MRDRRTPGFLVIAFSFAAMVLAPVSSAAQDTPWTAYLHDGNRALQHGRYAEAEKGFRQALREAEAFGPHDLRVATTLNDLAFLYGILGRYAEAEPLYRRALEIWEKALGPEHPLVGIILDRTAALLRKLRREAEAATLEIRARAIWAKHGR